MSTTWIKRLENRSRSTITLLNKENSGTRGHNIAVPPGSSIAIDMAIPWAAVQTDFPGHHLEIVVGGVTRYWIWQATNADGDFIRFSTDAAWHNQGEHAHGYAGSATNIFEAVGGLISGNTEDLTQLVLTDRVIVVLDSHFETIPIAPKPPIPASTFIKQLENRSNLPVTLFTTEGNQNVTAAPGQTISLNTAVPWALADSGFFGFPARHLELALGGITRFWIWQHDNRGDGDYVRFSTNGTWSPLATRVKGFAETGVCPGDLVFTADRRIIVTNTDFEIMPDPLLLDGLLDLARQNMRPARRIGESAITPASEPKKSAVAFSFSFRQPGKRYEFRLGNDGKVVATSPDGTATTLDKAWSYKQLRKGASVTLPQFDLIAANGGRVFAKVKNADDFYFLGMDHLFVEPAKDSPNTDITIASTYFKLDPEFAQSTANPADLMVTTENIPMNHPASERLPFFRRVLQKQPSDMMIAKVNAREWQQLDCRPPQNLMAFALRDLILEITPLLMAVLTLASGIGPLMLLMQLAYFTFLKDRWAEYLRERAETWGAPPDGIPTHTPITYQRVADGTTFAPPAIKYDRVIDIGVGHVHYYQQYQRTVGGEIQAMLLVKFYADLYRFFNGPLQDGDGYCDGTINYYALVKHEGATPSYSLLYQDEQAYFSQRWRLVGPDDDKGAMFSLVADLTHQPLYEWQSATYWCPFKTGHINDDSRLAVSAQVLLVTGKDPGTPNWQIYSINFSWGTMDRSWRRRDLPPGNAVIFDKQTVAPGEEPITASDTNTSYPQTIRLRDDMTINLKGTHSSKVGRWYQRYLPADNNLVPPSTSLLAGQMPSTGYKHNWKFLPEDVFRLTDNFYYFGVYDTVDSRTQYYDVTPATATDAATLDAAGPGPWKDDARQLYVSQWKFRWEETRLLGAKPLDAPSLFNQDTLLRIVRKGTRWIATFWDKRDNDMIPFERLPRQVTLKARTPQGTDVTVNVTIGANHSVLQPPVVQNAYFWLEPNGTAGIAFESSAGPNALRENVSRVRMASLEADAADPTRVGRVNWFLSKDTEGNFAPIGPGVFEFRWTPTPTDLSLLQQHATVNGEMQKATSIWFEDIVGNVAPPQQTIWERSPRAKGIATPAMIPLGVPTQVTVRASDFRTGSVLGTGVVKVDGQAVGTAGVPFTFTFNTRVEEEFDAELHITIRTVVNPVITVTVPDYPEADVPVTFFTPKLDPRLEPASVPIGPTVQVVVRAEDATTHSPVQGRVMIAGVDVAATNVPFNFAFGPTNLSGGVTAAGYPTKGFPIGLFTPEMQVSVSPSPIPTGLPVQVTVRAIDKRTGLPVNGRVKLNGVDTAATNTPFMFTFGLTPPSGVVSAQFYADVAIAWPPLFVSTLQTGIAPMPIPINKTIQCTVSAQNAQTGGLISGRVKIDGTDVGATNAPFSTIFKPRRVGAEGELMMPKVTVSAFGYNTTLVDTGF
jgi:hypothetical protein